MYTTILKHQFSVKDIVSINSAVLETVTTDDDKITTLIHAYKKTFLVEYDLNKKYNLDDNHLLYQARELANPNKFKAGDAPKTQFAHCIFLMNTTTGWWGQKYPTPLHTTLFAFDIRDADGNLVPFRDEAWCVDTMLADMKKPEDHIIRSYLRPLPPNTETLKKDASMVIIGDSKYESAKQEFDAAFRMAENHWVNKNHSGR